jgi:tRNA dimethylallyltransferase
VLPALVGPTASGKTEAGIAIAEALGAEIVSVDSMLVYRGMDIGTAKPGPRELARVPHHLLDLVDPSEPFSVSVFQSAGREVLRDIQGRGATPLLVGGSGLYLRAIVDDLEFPGTEPEVRRQLEREATVRGAGPLFARLTELDPAAADKIEPSNVRRTVRALEVAAVTARPFSGFAESWGRYPPERARIAGIALSREALVQRIEARVGAMIARGFLDEVRALVDRGFGGWLTSTQAIGYAEMAAHLAGESTLEDAVTGTVKRTKALARRQTAWFRRDPRVRWFQAGSEGAAALTDEIVEYLKA